MVITVSSVENLVNFKHKSTVNWNAALNRFGQKIDIKTNQYQQLKIVSNQNQKKCCLFYSLEHIATIYYAMAINRIYL